MLYNIIAGECKGIEVIQLFSENHLPSLLGIPLKVFAVEEHRIVAMNSSWSDEVTQFVCMSARLYIPPTFVQKKLWGKWKLSAFTYEPTNDPWPLLHDPYHMTPTPWSLPHDHDHDTQGRATLQEWDAALVPGPVWG